MTLINKNELEACALSHMQCSGDQVKNQNKVVTRDLEERANLPSHETAEEETVSPLEKQILIFLVIQKLKNVSVSVFLCAHKCLLISKSVSGRCSLEWFFLTRKCVLGSDHPNLTTNRGSCSLCGKTEKHHLEDSMHLSL